MPAIYVASYAVMRAGGRAMPDPVFVLADIAILAGVSFVAAAGEEIRWMGVGIGPLRDFTVAAGVLIVWLSEHTSRSLLAPALFHVTINLGVALFPNNGATYDATISGPITAALALVAAVWGLRTVERTRLGQAQPA